MWPLVIWVFWYLLGVAPVLAMKLWQLVQSLRLAMELWWLVYDCRGQDSSWKWISWVGASLSGDQEGCRGPTTHGDSGATSPTYVLTLILFMLSYWSVHIRMFLSYYAFWRYGGQSYYDSLTCNRLNSCSHLRFARYRVLLLLKSRLYLYLMWIV